MMAVVTSIKAAGGRQVPQHRSTDALGACLRNAFACPSLPDDMAMLLQRIDRPPHPR